MDITKLMIGDWVYNTHHKKSVSLTPYDFFTHGHDKDGQQQYLMPSSKPTTGRDLEPIKLTKEILEKNDFRRLGEQYPTWCLQGFGFSLNFIDGVFGYYEQGHPHHPTFVIKYVHELQHALELFGIDKEIEL